MEKLKQYFYSKSVTKVLTMVLIVVGIVLFLETCLITYMLGTYKYIYKGVQVGGIELGGMTRKQAAVLLEEKIPEINSKSIKFVYEDFSKEIQLDSLVEEIDYEKMALAARQVGREGKILDRFREIIRLRRDKKELVLQYKVNIIKLRNALYEMKDVLDKDVVEGKILKEPEKPFEIINDQKGMHLMIDESINKAVELIEGEAPYDVIPLVVQDDVASVNSNFLSYFKDVLGEYSTDCSSSSIGRLENLKNATSKLNAKILFPGDVLYFNSVVGPINSSNGYKSAGIILNGAPAVGIGGGVCQVSTTLYNAVLLSELEVLNRKNHSLAVSYVPLGRDAAVSDGTVDFAFKNTSSFPIYIEAYVLNGKVVVKIYGDSSYKKFDRIELENKIITTYQPLNEVVSVDETLPSNTKVVDNVGVKGYQVELYKRCFKDDKEVLYGLVNTSKYLPSASHIRVSSDYGKIVTVEEETNSSVSDNELMDFDVVENVANE